MELQKIKIGQSYPFVSRKGHGRGKVTDIETKTTGAWITVHDKGKDKSFIVRPSQIGVTPETYGKLKAEAHMTNAAKARRKAEPIAPVKAAPVKAARKAKR